MRTWLYICAISSGLPKITLGFAILPFSAPFLDAATLSTVAMGTMITLIEFLAPAALGFAAFQGFLASRSICRRLIRSKE